MLRRTSTVFTILLAASPALALDFDERPIPQNNERESARVREGYDWNRRTLEGAYERVGKKNPRWDVAARQALDAAARMFTRQFHPVPRYQDALEPARRAIAAGCDDPMILYLNYRFALEHDDPGPLESEKRLAIAAAALERSKYPAFRVSTALCRLGVIRAYRDDPAPSDREEAAKLFDKVLTLLPQSAREEERGAFWDERWYSELRALTDGLIKLGLDDQAAFDRVDKVLAGIPELKGLRLRLRGAFFTQYAWDARGSGFANSVTEDGARKFAARLAEARRALDEAWKAEPDNGRTAALMLNVEKGIGGDRASMETWFERAMTADGNNLNACESKMDWLDPKWHGSHASMMAFGRACRATKNWRAGITLLMADAHFRAGQRLPAFSRQEYLHSNEVWRDIEGVYTDYLDHLPDDRAARSLCAAFAVLCGRYAEADKQFRMVGEDLVGNQTFTVAVLKQLRLIATTEVNRLAANAGDADADARPLQGRSYQSVHPAVLPKPPGFLPLALPWTDATGASGTLEEIDHCLSTEAGFDVLCDTRSVYLVKGPDRARRVFTAEPGYVRLMEPCYDGRFLWIPVAHQNSAPFLVVIDPPTERRWTVTIEDGLPVKTESDLPPDTTQFLLAAPVGPGKCCAAGLHTGLWIANIAFDPERGPRFERILEANTPLKSVDGTMHDRTDLAARPVFMVTLAPAATSIGDSKKGRPILLGRSGSQWLNQRPLLIDPDAKTVKSVFLALDFMARGESGPGCFDLVGDRLIWVQTQRRSPDALSQFGPPDFREVAKVNGLNRAKRVAAVGDKVEVVGESWWECDLSTGEARQLDIKLPWTPVDPTTPAGRGAVWYPGTRFQSLAWSRHLGFLVQVVFGNQGRVSYRVDLEAARAKKAVAGSE